MKKERRPDEKSPFDFELGTRRVKVIGPEERTESERELAAKKAEISEQVRDMLVRINRDLEQEAGGTGSKPHFRYDFEQRGEGIYLDPRFPVHSYEKFRFAPALPQALPVTCLGEVADGFQAFLRFANRNPGSLRGRPAKKIRFFQFEGLEPGAKSKPAQSFILD